MLEARWRRPARLAALPAATYATVKAQLRAPALAQMRAALERDPLADGWLSDETERPQRRGECLDRDEASSTATRPRPGSRPG